MLLNLVGKLITFVSLFVLVINNSYHMQDRLHSTALLQSLSGLEYIYNKQIHNIYDSVILVFFQTKYFHKFQKALTENSVFSCLVFFKHQIFSYLTILFLLPVFSVIDLPTFL